MNEAFTAIDNAIQEVKKLRANLKRKNHPQVRSSDECNLIKATSFSWFKNHREVVASSLDQGALNNINLLYQAILQACDRATSRKVYDTRLKNLFQELTSIKTALIDASTTKKITLTTDNAPDFSPLTTDVLMQKILISRWEECWRCIVGNAPLAATVMMGGFLETLLLTRVNKEIDLSTIYTAKTSRKDNKTGKPLPLKDWTLRNYIDVAHELKWISQSAKDVGEVLRDYRNYIHPYKQFSRGTEFTLEDASLFWEITKSISRQLLTQPV